MDTRNIYCHNYSQVVNKMVFILNPCFQKVPRTTLLCDTLFYLKGSDLVGNTFLGVSASISGKQSNGESQAITKIAVLAFLFFFPTAPLKHFKSLCSLVKVLNSYSVQGASSTDANNPWVAIT